MKFGLQFSSNYNWSVFLIKFCALMFIHILLIGCSQMKVVKTDCDEINKCVELASSITGKKYIYGGESLNGPIKTYGKVTWTKENADDFVGEMLHGTGYARVQMKDKDTYQIINARDIRYTAHLPSFFANKNTNDALLPANSGDWGELIYKTITTKVNRSSDIARNLRPFMSRYGRVIDDPMSGVIIIRDNLANIHQMLPIIRKLDNPVTQEELNERDRQRSHEILREKTRQETIKKFEEYIKNKKVDEKVEN